MKKILSSVIVFISSLLFLLPLGSSASFAQTVGSSSFCQPPSKMGYFVQLEKAKFKKGKTVIFCLINNTRNPLFLQPGQSLPWEIVKLNSGKVIYQGIYSGSSVQQMPSLYIVTWNQKDNNGKQVSGGKYEVIFTSSVNHTSATFTISGNRKHHFDKDNDSDDKWE